MTGLHFNTEPSILHLITVQERVSESNGSDFPSSIRPTLLGSDSVVVEEEEGADVAGWRELHSYSSSHT